MKKRSKFPIIICIVVLFATVLSSPLSAKADIVWSYDFNDLNYDDWITYTGNYIAIVVLIVLVLIIFLNILSKKSHRIENLEPSEVEEEEV